MRLVLLTALFALSTFGQVIIEDFKCQIPMLAVAGNPTRVVCDDGHGFSGARASAIMTAWSPVAGDTFTIAGVTYRWVTSLVGCSANDIKIAASGDYGSFVNVALNNFGAVTAALNGTETGMATDNGASWKAIQMKGVHYCSSTTQNPYVSGSISFSFSSAYVYLMARTGGPASQYALSRTGTGVGFYERDRVSATTQMKIQWGVQITGATGGWAGVNNAIKVATYVDDNTYSIKYNSTTAGSWDGQSWVTPRWSLFSDHTFTYHDSSNLPGPIEVRQNGSLGVYTYGCADTDTDIACGLAYLNPENGKLYGAEAPITNFTVSGGVATVAVGRWVDPSQGTPYTVGERFQLRGFHKYYISRSVTAAVQNGANVTVTAAAHGCVVGDQAYIDAPSSIAGTWPITAITTTTVDLIGATLDAPYVSGSVITCNPQGREAQEAAGHFARLAAGGIRPPAAPKFVTVSGLVSDATSSFTFATTLADGVYSGTLTAHLQPKATPYVYTYPRTTQSGKAWYVPNDMLKYHIKSGAVHPKANRLRYWINWGPTAKRYDNAKYTTNLGTESVTSMEGTGDLTSHFYHYTAANAYAGVWAQYEFNNAPSHIVNAMGGSLLPENPTAGHAMSPSWRGGRTDWNYMDGQQSVYIDPGGLGQFTTSQNFGYTTSYFGRIEIDYSAGEPEEWVRSRVSLYSPNRFIAGGSLVADAGYEVSWDGIPDQDVRFNTRYSTTGSLKTAGWSTGTDGGIVSEPGYTSGNRGALWQSPTMAEADNFYLAIRPIMLLVGATTAGNDNWLILRSHSGMAAGDKVTTAGAGGNRDVTDQAIAETVSHRYWFVDQPATDERPSWIVGGGRLTSIVAAAGTCTATFTEAHGLLPGWVVEVIGSTNTTLGGAGGNWWNTKRYTVATIPTTSSLAFACAGVPNGAYSTSASGYRMNLHAFPGVRLTATATGTWSGSGTLVSTEENKNFAQVYLPKYGAAPAATIPAAPCSASATSTGQTSISLTWADCSSDEDSFIVRRATFGGEYSQIATTGPNATSYADSGLTANTIYIYQVYSRNAQGESATYASATASTDAIPEEPWAPDGRVTLSVSRRGTAAIVTLRGADIRYQTSCTVTAAVSTGTSTSGLAVRRVPINGIDPAATISVVADCGAAGSGATTAPPTVAMSGNTAVPISLSCSSDVTVNYGLDLASTTTATHSAGRCTASLSLPAGVANAIQFCRGTVCGAPIYFIP